MSLGEAFQRWARIQSAREQDEISAIISFTYCQDDG